MAQGVNMRGGALRAGILICFAGAALGCDQVANIGPDICDRSESGNPPVVYKGGTVENGIYMSSAWDKDLLYFPGGMRYSIEHKLGDVPRFWQFYLSFDHDGTSTGVVSPAAGNQAELRGINDTMLEVVNGSCAEYWLLVVAGGAEIGGPTAEEDSGAGEAAPH